MAIYRLSADIVRRSEGRTVTAAAAYRSAELIIDQRTGLAFDYRRRHGVIEVAILAPSDAPAWTRDRVQLWNAVEAAEKRKDAQLSRDIELALPHELSPGDRRELVHRFARAAFVDAGMVADIALHAPDAAGDGRNFHAHILLTLRRIEGDGFGGKERAWNDAAQLEQWRALWADHVNQALEIAGTRAHVDHRSLEAQGVERVAQIHLGQAVIEMQRRGIATERTELAQEIDAVNGELRSAEKLSLWRRAADELVRHMKILPLKLRRREDTGRAFKVAATITHQALPAVHAAAAFLADTLDWLNLWHPDAGDELAGDIEPNHLFPQP